MNKSVKGMDNTVHEYLQELIVRRKGPRMYRGEVVDDGAVRLVMTVHPLEYQAHLWRSALHFLKAYVVKAGGYVSYQQPPPPGIRKLTGSRNKSDWE